MRPPAGAAWECYWTGHERRIERVEALRAEYGAHGTWDGAPIPISECLLIKTVIASILTRKISLNKTT
jgi:hypothetical protein